MMDVRLRRKAESARKYDEGASVIGASSTTNLVAAKAGSVGPSPKNR
jgi:hypothetical protein